MRPADRALAALLDDLGAATPAPGGGAAVAWAGALAGALTEMAAVFAAGRPGSTERAQAFAACAERAGELRRLTLELAERDIDAYGPVLDALRLSHDDPDRERRLRAASSRAAEPPLAIARACVELAELGVELVQRGNPHLIGDAAAGVLLAEAACAGAVRLVRINLAGADDDPRVGEAESLAQRASEARRRVTD